MSLKWIWPNLLNINQVYIIYIYRYSIVVIYLYDIDIAQYIISNTAILLKGRFFHLQLAAIPCKFERARHRAAQ